MSVKAYRKTLDFLPQQQIEKYLLFLKKHALDVSPQYYVVVESRPVMTTDGPMYAVRISTDIEDPEFEPIAESWINNQIIYVWQDQCWGIAVNKDGKQMLKYEVEPPQPISFINKAPYSAKTALIFQIGQDKI